MIEAVMQNREGRIKVVKIPWDQEVAPHVIAYGTRLFIWAPRGDDVRPHYLECQSCAVVEVPDEG